MADVSHGSQWTKVTLAESESQTVMDFDPCAKELVLCLLCQESSPGASGTDVGNVGPRVLCRSEEIGMRDTGGRQASVGICPARGEKAVRGSQRHFQSYFSGIFPSLIYASVTFSGQDRLCCNNKQSQDLQGLTKFISDCRQLFSMQLTEYNLSDATSIS